MPDAVHIQAVTVNHNTSLFAELMLRSLFATHGPELRISATVMDNHSVDTDDFQALEEYGRSRGIPVVQTGFDTNRGESGAVNTHGEILRAFVLDNPECSHYLFVDPDVYFMTPDSIRTMIAELDAEPGAFGVVARFTADGRNEIEMPSGNSQTGEHFQISCTMRTPEGAEYPAGTFDAVLKQRIHPFCTLVRNTKVFRTVVEEVGLSSAFVEAEKAGAFYDTLGLLTAVMRTHGLGYIVSSVMVLHFFNVSYSNQWLEDKRRRCVELLQPLRTEMRNGA